MLRELDTLTGSYIPPTEVSIDQDFVPIDPYKYIYCTDVYFSKDNKKTWAKYNGKGHILKSDKIYCKAVKTTKPNWSYILTLPFLKMCRAITMIIADNIKFK
jgi:hypothetical protein